MTTPSSLEKAIGAAGSQQRLADLLGIRSSSISEWKLRNKVPAERVLAVESATGVSRHALRPDVFGPGPEVDAPGGDGENETAASAPNPLAVSK